MKHVVQVFKSQLHDKAAVTFEGAVSGKLVQGVVTRSGEKYFAYQNICKHIPITLDCGDGNITTDEGGKLQCHMHGAIYELETGECTAGPCVGARLNPFKVIDDGARLIIELPDMPEIT